MVLIGQRIATVIWLNYDNMEKISKEQFAKTYGQTTLSRFDQMNGLRRGSQETPFAQTQSKPLSNKITDTLGLGGATDVFGSLLARQGVGTQTKAEGQEFVEKPTKGQVAGAVLQTAAIPAGFALTGGTSVLGQAAIGAGIGFSYDVGQDLIDKKSAAEIATPGLGTVIGGVAPVAIRGAAAGVGALKNKATPIVKDAGEAIVNAIPDSQTLSGIKQTASELGDRVPRFIGKVSEKTKEAGIRAERIKTSPPLVQQAIKSGLPEPLIDPIKNANPITKQAFKEVLDIADTPRTKLGQKQNPAIVGGNKASQQYDIIEAQRKNIGEAMNVETAKLGKIEDINMTGAYSQLDSVLEDIGVVKDITEKGFKLNFSKSKLTQKQRTVVVDLYEKATEGGNALSPLQIREKDQLFSAIQRESRSDAVQDVIFTTADGQTTDLFRAFRDVYSNELDVLSPEIKKLNSQYRNVATLLEDIENSIFKTPNFEITKNTDPSEFAKVNLRRIFGEAQSSPAYEAIADEMDAISRQLGYNGASPKEVAEFAEEIRKLYPEKVPKAGFQGGIRAGLSDIASSIMEAGKADTTDQRKALRALLEAIE